MHERPRDQAVRAAPVLPTGPLHSQDSQLEVLSGPYFGGEESCAGGAVSSEGSRGGRRADEGRGGHHFQVSALSRFRESCMAVPERQFPSPNSSSGHRRAAGAADRGRTAAQRLSCGGGTKGLGAAIRPRRLLPGDAGAHDALSSAEARSDDARPGPSDARLRRVNRTDSRGRRPERGSETEAALRS